jgi:predicted nucleic acid-binding Zn ribbon protein
MILTFICEACGARAEVWRQLSKNMPAELACSCGGKAYPDMRIQAPSVLFRGEGWTPRAHSSDVVLDLGGDDE